MPSTKDIKKRITTVKSTQQITRALKMVSAAKLRRAQEAILNQRPYAKRVGELIQLVSSLSDAPIEHPLIRNQLADAPPKDRVLIMLVTSDRGSCGAFNNNIIKLAVRWAKENEGKYESVQFGFVGRRGYDFFKNKKVTLGPYFAESGGKVTFDKAKHLSDRLVELFTSGGATRIIFMYNEFKNAVSQKPVAENFLPIESDPARATSVNAPDEASSASGVFILKPGHYDLLMTLLDKNFAVQAFRILLESQAGEHGARMSAMENATKNAGDMIRRLTLQYNKQRQAGITKELLEIIAGSESQKG